MKKEVREGYKMTELGEIPEEWEVKRLDETSELIDGDRSSKYPGNKDITDEGILFLSTQNIVNSKLVYENCKFITEDKFNELGKGKLEKDDLVITLRGSIGNIAKFKGDKYETGFINAQLMIIRSNNINSEYLNKYLNSYNSQNQINNISSGSAQPQLTKGDLKTLKIIVPTKEEQEKIASILSTVDEQIDNTEKLIQKNQELKKGLMQQLLTKGIGHTKFKKTEIGKIPEEWEVLKLSDIANVIDSLHETPEYSEQGFSMIRVVDVNGKAIDTSKTNKVSIDIYNKFTRKYKPQKDDIIMSRVGSYGGVSYLKDSENVCLGQNIVVINTRLNKRYLFYVLSSEYVKKNIEKLTVGSSQKTLSLANINDLKVLIPSEQEQEKIASLLSSVDEKIEEYENKKEKLEELKKGLMQQLLTGNIRVN
ncbi:restriction endonuclease subunit S [Clostridium baratii]|uniref:restriction endonuclease subunit S n=1 Tax=Clostridium baratii TaxID=1561 RepID=UPI0005F29E5C|nr:restriction endonuclease subunit S [Clostridium baratii]KJU71826.1 hypothetical protein UC77_07600 [Clostridium baratii]